MMFAYDRIIVRLHQLYWQQCIQELNRKPKWPRFPFMYVKRMTPTSCNYSALWTEYETNVCRKCAYSVIIERRRHKWIVETFLDVYVNGRFIHELSMREFVVDYPNYDNIVDSSFIYSNDKDDADNNVYHLTDKDIYRVLMNIDNTHS